MINEVECLLCHVKYRSLTPHLCRSHHISTYEYLQQFPNALLTCVATKQQMSETQKSTYKEDLSRAQRVSETNRKLRKDDPTVNQRQSESNLLAYQVDPTIVLRKSETMIRLNKTDPTIGQRTSKTLRETHKVDPTISWRQSSTLIQRNREDPTIQQRHSETWIRRCKEDPTIGQRRSKVLKEKWKSDPIFAAYMIASWKRSPNGSELYLGEVLEKHFPGLFKFVGNSIEGRIGGKVADFIDTKGLKIIVEMFGLRYHDPSVYPERLTEDELIAHYDSYGFKCLVFWEDVVWCDEDLIVNRVRSILNV
jgi:very-short-patch-repair endonuclease